MRLDAETMHPAEKLFVRVYLNGLPQRGVMLADDEGGEVRRYKRDLDGLLVRDESGAFVVETVRGDVRIELPQARI